MKSKWERNHNEMTCPECGFIYYSNKDDFDFCPNCGEPMNEEAEKKVKVVWHMLPQLPPEDERVFVCCQTKKGVKSVNIAYQSDGIWHGNGSMSGVIAWMPLPELPEGGKLK